MAHRSRMRVFYPAHCNAAYIYIYMQILVEMMCMTGFFFVNDSKEMRPHRLRVKYAFYMVFLALKINLTVLWYESKVFFTFKTIIII